jgi:hypothetical protein
MDGPDRRRKPGFGAQRIAAGNLRQVVRLAAQLMDEVGDQLVEQAVPANDADHEEAQGIDAALEKFGIEMSDLVWVQESSPIAIFREDNNPVLRALSSISPATAFSIRAGACRSTALIPARACRVPCFWSRTGIRIAICSRSRRTCPR